MGDYAELVTDGLVCMECGEPFDEACGFPRLCPGCDGGGDFGASFEPRSRRKQKHGGTPKLRPDQRTERNRRKRQRRRERQRERKNQAGQPAATERKP